MMSIGHIGYEVAQLRPEWLQRPWAAPYRISSPGMAKCVLIKTRSIISSAQSPYKVCTVLRQPAKAATEELSTEACRILIVLGMVGFQKESALFYQAIDGFCVLD